MLFPVPAQAQTVYDISVGAPFFEEGIPGFSLRIYPSSIEIHKGDVLHFVGDGVPFMFREGEHPEEWVEENRINIGDRYADVVRDPDEGEDAYKFNPVFEGNADCTDAADPCEWSGQGADILNPGFAEEGWIAITANPGDVIWAAHTDESYLRIEVVADGAAASTQAELDQRAENMRNQDYNDLFALHYKYLAKNTSHIGPDGRRVWDAWAGVDYGPMGLDAMYPKRLRIRRGDTVQWHFNYTFNAHTVTMPFRKGVALSGQYFDFSNAEFGPVCDPDGDGGTQPDVRPPPPADPEEEPQCPEGTTPEFDLNPREMFPAGNGVFTGARDFEHSGVRTPEYMQPGFGNEDPFNVRFRETSSDKGFRYLCTIHGPFMSGRVIVRR